MILFSSPLLVLFKKIPRIVCMEMKNSFSETKNVNREHALKLLYDIHFILPLSLIMIV